MAVQLLMNFTVKNDQHFGHLLLHCMKASPEAICQIDAATGKKETNASVISRSIRLARSLRKFGLQPGDVLAISGKNHLDIHIPYYAAVCNGLPICGVDNSFKYNEVKALFKVVLPKIAFCDKETYDMFKQVVQELNLNTTVIKFGEVDDSMNEFIDKYDDNAPLTEFKVAEFDVEKIYMWLPATSGSTGVVKVAAIRHIESMTKFVSYLQSLIKVTRMAPSVQRVNAFNVGPIHWLTGIFNAIGMPIMGQCKVQSSGPIDADHLLDVINQYKPVSILTSPALLTSLLKNKKPCDLSSLKVITVTGAKLRRELYEEGLARLSEGSYILNLYGQTENIGPMMWSNPLGPTDAFTMPSTAYEAKLVDPETGKEVTEPMGQGELWTRGPRFTEYYRNPEETKKAITEDGWYKTGDIFAKDDADNFYFVERLKTLIKYRNYHVVPAELEELIRTHPGVRDVIVTSIPHDDDSEHPVACVVKQNGSLTARDVINLVAEKLSDSKRLRGGVIFFDEIPMTSTGKVALGKLKKIVLQSEREI